MTVDWGAGSYERIAEAFAPVHDHLAERLDPRPGARRAPWCAPWPGTAPVTPLWR